MKDLLKLAAILGSACFLFITAVLATRVSFGEAAITALVCTCIGLFLGLVPIALLAKVK